MPRVTPYFSRDDRRVTQKINVVARELDKSTPSDFAQEESGFIGDQIQYLELVGIDNPNRVIAASVPGDTSNEIFIVTLPGIFTDTARGSTTYVYSGLNNRTATDGGVVEEQEITPPFIIGDRFYAILLDDLTGEYAFLGDGRMWAKTG